MTVRKKNINEIISLISIPEGHGETGRRDLIVKIRIFEEFYNAMEAIMFIYDMRLNRLIWINDNCSKILGFDTGEILSLGTDETPELLHPEDAGIKQEGIDLLLSGKRQSYSGIIRVLHKECRWVWMLFITCVLLRNEECIPTHALGMAIDFSPHRQIIGQFSRLILEHRRLNNYFRVNLLTPKEKEVISLIASGLSCKEISNHMGISYYTAETHIRNIRQKLELRNNSALICFAIENGLDTQPL
jgi:DNA-binding CsgD family transcriptional regulator